MYSIQEESHHWFENIVLPAIKRYYATNKFSDKKNIFITSNVKEYVRGPFKLNELNDAPDLVKNQLNNITENKKCKHVIVIIKGSDYISFDTINIILPSEYYLNKYKIDVIEYYKNNNFKKKICNWIFDDRNNKVIGPINNKVLLTYISKEVKHEILDNEGLHIYVIVNDATIYYTNLQLNQL